MGHGPRDWRSELLWIGVIALLAAVFVGFLVAVKAVDNHREPVYGRR